MAKFLAILTGYTFYGQAEPFLTAHVRDHIHRLADELVIARHVAILAVHKPVRQLPPCPANPHPASRDLDRRSPLNLAVLGFFKYFNFGSSWNTLAESRTYHTQIRHFLPCGAALGIGFYTFQALSYTIDVYRGEAEAMSTSSISPASFPCSRTWWRARS
jgi:alginate O-acetyltransferase complex protein AlgI